MAARKLQSEIDRTLKRVSEGVELFENTYDKMQTSTNQTQKEKLESDLKNQIKKLQRMRDQIRAWVASNDIKDKTQLLDNRKLIETQMEKFKACEKEVKKKAFSNVALGEAVKLDPKEQETLEAIEWLETQLEKLQMQVEQAEAEVESIQGAAKKKFKAGSTTAGRLDELEHLNFRRMWHVGRLEIVLRLLNNGSLEAEKVFALKDDVHYFVETNAEEDFTEYEGIYDELNLDEEEEKFRGGLDDNDDDESDIVVEELLPRPPVKKASEENSKRAESPILKKTATLQLRKQSDAKPPPNFSVQSMASILKPAAPRPPLPPIRYSAAVQQAPPPPPQAAPAPASLAPAPVPSKQSQPPPSIPPPPSSVDVSSSPSMTHPSAASPMSSYASVSHEPDSSFYSGAESPAFSEAMPGSVGGPAATSSPQRILASRKDSFSSAPRLPSPPPSTTHRVLPEPSQPRTEHDQPQQQQAPQFPPGVKIEQSATATPGPSQTIGGHRQANGHALPAPLSPSSFPAGLADLVMPFQRAKQNASQRMANVEQLHKYLAGGLSSIPQPQDTVRGKYYVPRNPFQTAPYYPQTPHPMFNNPAIYSQVDVETLFYVFYFCPTSYPQYLAAEELKRQSWRFHVKYLTWFQRHSEPQAITDEYEQGVYVYFDWEGSWCQRKKADFRFEYRYLSED